MSKKALRDYVAEHVTIVDSPSGDKPHIAISHDIFARIEKPAGFTKLGALIDSAVSDGDLNPLNGNVHSCLYVSQWLGGNMSETFALMALAYNAGLVKIQTPAILSKDISVSFSTQDINIQNGHVIMWDPHASPVRRPQPQSLKVGEPLVVA